MDIKETDQYRFPWQHPKLSDEDPIALKLVETIMNSPTYEIAELDANFMKSYEARGIRLELDYLKAELAMSRFGIEHTIVVFGSARIVEYKTAMKRLNIIQKELDSNPKSKELLEKMHVAERMVEKSIYYDDARLLGNYIGKSGKSKEDCRVILMTGGGPGIMEAANRGAYDVGAKSIGLNIHLPHEQYPNPYITPELSFQFRYFAIRKLHFLNRARALIVYPGGFGTFDELFEVLTLVQTKKSKPIPIVLVGENYWNKALNFDFLKEEGVISSEDSEILKVVENATEAWKYILHWHEKMKMPLFK
jgi:uncharacterized protein (TIGR00730 family)